MRVLIDTSVRALLFVLEVYTAIKVIRTVDGRIGSLSIYLGTIYLMKEMRCRCSELSHVRYSSMTPCAKVVQVNRQDSPFFIGL